MSMTKTICRLVGMGAVMGLVLAGNGVRAEGVVLKVADTYPPNHFISTQGTKPWMERITALTEGRVTFQYFPASQLGTLADLPTLVRSGAADIGLVAAGILPGEFPLSAVAGIPGTAKTATGATMAYAKITAQDGPLSRELTDKGLKPLAYFGLPQYEIFMTNKPIRALEDLRGAKLAALGGLQQEVVIALGASPVSVPTSDTYTALERGTVDGKIIPYPSARGYRLEEVTKYATAGAALGTSVVGYAISQRRWDALPADVQEAIVTASGEFMERISTFQDEDNATARNYLAERGVEFITLSPEESEKWNAAFQPVAENWIETQEAKGLSARGVYDQWIEALAE